MSPGQGDRIALAAVALEGAAAVVFFGPRAAGGGAGLLPVFGRANRPRTERGGDRGEAGAPRRARGTIQLFPLAESSLDHRVNWFVVAEVLGGVALFLVGMQWLSRALRELAGDRLRAWLTAATKSRLRGLFLGTAFGALAHSSAASVLVIGFLNAGLLSLAGALPLLFGANVGTTLSMQLVSLRLTDYALAAVAVGGIGYLFGPTPKVKTAGRAVLGFGLLFLGMKISGGAIAPYRDALAPYLAAIDGSTWTGLVFGVLVAAAITGIVQSSGAVIGMTFVLAGSGVITSLTQAYPIVLGAHIGTSVTGLIASIGTVASARRAALGNTAFNIANAAFGIVAAGALIPLLEQSSPDIVRQIANTHTAIMVIAAAAFLPFTEAYARLLERVFFPRAPEPAGSFLAPELLDTPEDALVATLHEIGRSAELCRESFGLVMARLDGGEAKFLRRVRLNEGAVDEIKTSVRAFLAALARGYLSRRQAFLAQSLNRCIIEIERISDHIESLAVLAAGEGVHSLAELDPDTAADVRSIAEKAHRVVERLSATLRTEPHDFASAAATVLAERERYREETQPLRERLEERLAEHRIEPQAALACSEFLATMDRIVRHCAVIAREQAQPAFRFKPSKLGRPRGPARQRARKGAGDAADHL
ncbi:MAG: Na/Pi cotransporter family protein [Verrucomicrobia bacterium]|nr:MAG: Na/Pi cotransporter family protein [Verrucomicrobiota bacterium]